MHKLKENDEKNLGQDGHIGGGGYKSAPVKKKKLNLVVIAIAIALAVITYLILN